jgi:hypothetical protein
VSQNPNLKITVAFDPSPDAEVDKKAGKPGKYRARLMFDHGDKGQQEMPGMEIPADKPEFTIEAPEGQAVILIVAYVNAAGQRSPGTPFQFVVQKFVPPRRPSNGRVKRVVPMLDVLGSEAPGSTGFLASVVDHPDLIDGAVGRVESIDEDEVSVLFDHASMKPGTDISGPLRYVLTGDDGTCKTQIITPDQQMVPLNEFLVSQRATALSV